MIPTLPEIVMGIMRPHVGERNGITRTWLLALVNEQLGIHCQEWIDDRALRRVYVTLPLISGDFGLCIPADWSEVLRFEAYIFSKISGPDAQMRVRIVKSAYPHLAPQPKQMELGI
jgi:hypothetical protein